MTPLRYGLLPLADEHFHDGPVLLDGGNGLHHWHGVPAYADSNSIACSDCYPNPSPSTAAFAHTRSKHDASRDASHAHADSPSAGASANGR